ncbi:MAG: hypothetical protein AABW80_03785 [Nanoarchaeota archaeon]
MVTSIQISEKLQEALAIRKLNDRESYEDIIWDLIDDDLELSEEDKRDIEKSKEDIKKRRVHRWEDVKKELNINV